MQKHPSLVDSIKQKYQEHKLEKQNYNDKQKDAVHVGFGRKLKKKKEKQQQVENVDETTAAAATLPKAIIGGKEVEREELKETKRSPFSAAYIG